MLFRSCRCVLAVGLRASDRAAVLDSLNKTDVFLSIEACKPILVVTQNKIMSLRKTIKLYV